MTRHQIEAKAAQSFEMIVASASGPGRYSKKLVLKVRIPTETIFYEVYVDNECVCATNTYADAVSTYNER